MQASEWKSSASLQFGGIRVANRCVRLELPCSPRIRRRPWLVHRPPSLMRGRPYESRSRANEGDRCASEGMANAGDGIGLPTLSRRSAKHIRRRPSLSRRGAKLVRRRPSLICRSAKLICRSAKLICRCPAFMRGRSYELSSRVNEGDRCAGAGMAKAREGIGRPSLSRRSAKLIRRRASLLRRNMKLAPRHRSEGVRDRGAGDARPLGRRLRPSQADRPTNDGDARPREGCTKEREPPACPSKRAPSAGDGNRRVSKMAVDRTVPAHDAKFDRRP
jgi:hypothetical protein